MKTDIEAMIGNITTDFNFTDIREYLPTLLDIFCPGENVCKDKNSYNISFDPETQSTKRCCSVRCNRLKGSEYDTMALGSTPDLKVSVCSCSDDCGMSNKCCFPKSESNASQERRNDNCYSTLYPDDGYNEQTGYKSYMMIDREYIDETSDSSTNSSYACGDTEVAPWGTIYPVYSYTSKRIYKNHACAEAYGIEDYIKWRVYAECFTPHVLVNSIVHNDSNRTRLNRKCKVRFEFPGDKNELNDNICYKKLADTCPETFNTITTVSDKLLQAACVSGLASTYRGKNGMNFKNAFCSICNNQYFHDQECIDDRIIRNKYPYSALFDESSIIYLDQVDIETKAQQACLYPDIAKIQVKCRPVLCPTGQIYDNAGHCVFMLKYLYNLKIVVHLELISDTLLNMTDMTTDSLISPWPRNWIIEQYHYFSINGSLYTNKIIVLLHNDFNAIEQRVLTSLVSRFVKRKWTWKSNNSKILLNSYFTNARYRDMSISLPEYIGEVIKITYFDRSIHFEQNVVLDKLNYCQQVVLNDNEFTLINLFILINNLTGKYMVHGEYLFPNYPDTTRIRVCIEDSGLTLASRGNVKKTSEMCVQLSILYLVTSMFK
ncbi:hypothetical protein ACF0H5_021052 [Mactra antiquata]